MSQLEIEIGVMKAAGLGDNDILRLAALRRRIQVEGSCDDLTLDYKRALFLKHLYDRGKISESVNSDGLFDVNSQS